MLQSESVGCILRIGIPSEKNFRLAGRWARPNNIVVKHSTEGKGAILTRYQGGGGGGGAIVEKIQQITSDIILPI